MTKKEKELLLKSLCETAQYGVKGLALGKKTDTIKTICLSEYPFVVTNGGLSCHVGEQFKPYLRPMSSMTEEEKSWYESLRNALTYQENGEYDLDDFNELNDFLNRKKLDRYGLIEKGLALEASDGMYDTE